MYNDVRRASVEEENHRVLVMWARGKANIHSTLMCNDARRAGVEEEKHRVLVTWVSGKANIKFHTHTQ